MPKKKTAHKVHKRVTLSHRHHPLRRHFPTFFEQPLFGAGVLVLATVALLLMMYSR